MYLRKAYVRLRNNVYATSRLSFSFSVFYSQTPEGGITGNIQLMLLRNYTKVAKQPEHSIENMEAFTRTDSRAYNLVHSRVSILEQLFVLVQLPYGSEVQHNQAIA
jgi:hypothetical protein